MPKLGPYSCPDAFRAIDGRTWEGKLLRETRAQLTTHVGGNPSPPLLALIVRAAWLTLYLAQMDRRSADFGAMTEHDSNCYLAWSNSLARVMTRIGVAPGGHAKPGTALKQRIAEHSAAAA